MQPEHDRRRPLAGTASNVTGGDLHIVRRTADRSADLDPFTCGVLADAFNTGRRLWWLKRARDFEDAKPVPGEHHGNATRDELRARWYWCDAVARACRAKAELVGATDFDQELEDLLRDALGREDAGPVVCPVCGTPTSPWTCSCGHTRADGAA